MNKKKKIIIASLTALFVLVCGFFINNYKKTSSSNSTRVLVDSSKSDKDKVDKKLVDEKTDNTGSEDKEKKENNKIDEKTKEDKNKEEIKSKEETKEKEIKKVEDTSQKDNKDVKKETNTEAPPSKPENKPAPKEEVAVYMRVEGYDKTFVPRTKVATDVFDLNPYLGRASGSSATPSNGWGVDKFKEPTVAHALVKLLEANGYKHGDGYDLQDYGWGLYIAMIGGNREFDYRSTSGWMYRVNDVLPNIGCQGKPIKGGEEILWYFGAYGFDTLATEMIASAKNVKVGDSVTVTLNGIKNDINTWKEFREPAKGATIYVNGSPLSINGNNVVTDDNGKAIINFTKPGNYKVSAERVNEKGLKDIVRPETIVINVK